MAEEFDFDELLKLLAPGMKDCDSSENRKKSSNNFSGKEFFTDEEYTSTRKRGRKGRRKGFRSEGGFRGGFRSGKQMTQNWRRGQRGRSQRKPGARNMTDLTALPEGILLIVDGDYVGYHCTYCNCVLGSMATIKDHVVGFRHQLIVETKDQLTEEKQESGTIVQSESENSAEKSKGDGDKLEEGAEKSKDDGDKLEEDAGKPKDNGDKPEEEKSEDGGCDDTEEVKNEKETKDGEEKEAITESKPQEEPSLKSLLEDDLATISDPVVGLDYVIEEKRADKEPLFECSLCKFSADADDMKSHIIGTRHRLMYLKAKEPHKIAELMSKNLQKADRNKELRDYISLLMNQHGRGTVVVGSSESSSTRKGKQQENTINQSSLQQAIICGEEGNKSKDGPQPSSAKKIVCFKCGQQGHKSKICPQPLAVCKICGEDGHKGDTCPQRPTAGKVPCRICGEEGHKARACPRRPGKICFRCGQEGHRAAECQTVLSGKLGCFKCGQEGHKASRCRLFPKPKKVCDICGKVGRHKTKACPQRFTAGASQGNKDAFDKSTNVTAGAKRNSPYDEADSPIRKQQHGDSYPNNQVPMGEFTGMDQYPITNPVPFNNQYYQNSGNGGQQYKTDRNEERLTYGNNFRQESPSVHNREYGKELVPVDMTELNVTNEAEAGVVMNVINSLTERFLQYKLQNMAGPAKEVLEKSLKGENLLHSLGAVTGGNDTRIAEKVSNTSNLPKEEITGQHTNDFNERSDIATRGGVTDQLQRGWDGSRDTSYPRERMNQRRNDWDESRDATYPRDTMSQSQSYWDETRDGRSRDVTDYSQRNWDKDRNVIDQPQHTWNKMRDVAPARNTMDAQQDTRDPIYRRDVVNQSKHNWNENRNVTALKNDKPFEQFQHSWNETRRTYSKDNQNANSLNKFSHRQTSVTGKTNIDSFSQPRYGSNKSEELISLRNSNFDSFNQHGPSQGHRTWNETDSLAMKSQKSMPFGQPAMGWDEKSSSSQLRSNTGSSSMQLSRLQGSSSSTGSSSMQLSRLQGSSSSLPLKRNLDHPSYVDDLFDNYQKRLKAEKRSTVTSMDSGNRSHLTPSSTNRTQYVSSSAPLSYSRPSAPLSYSRPSAFGQQRSAGTFQSWKQSNFQ